MAFAGFGKNTGPSVTPNSNTPFGSFLSSNPNFSPKPNSNSDTYRSPSYDSGSSVSASQSHQKQLTPTRAERPVTSHNWDNQLRNHSYPMNPQNLSSPAFSRTTSGVSNTLIKANGHDSMEKANRPAVPLTWGNLGQSPITLSTNAHGIEPNIPIKPKIFDSTNSTRSPPFSSDEDILGLYSIPNADDRRLSTSPILNAQSKKQNNFHSINHKRSSPVINNANTEGVVVHSHRDPIDAYVAKRNRSPSFRSQVDDYEELETQNHSSGNVRKHEVSPPRSFNKNKAQVFATANTESMPMSTNMNSSKRPRSPPSQSAKMESISSSRQLDSEREMQAKAKRLARFNIELRQPMQTPEELAKKKFSGNQLDRTIFVKQKITDNPSEEPLNNMSREVISDNEVIESSKVIVGQCSDMCPESERDERERKGDLDKFERLNGERNQTSKFIAVKKYTRTAERDAYLIRPLPILRMTIDYLLSLLDQPYNENFLGIYNFLWDRMRAVRMDLRMQHIFNQDAILMLEQMIRLHILAMHELCEYKKGEGFTEGFDAHLNIEQMNKTSVELFQLYDDHRKKGKSISTEREFRGYYALLKLDKHPGYKVEPSELSLDLAKMTSEMRCTPEVLFARNVARACRTGNYIAFFRLARKATYLQACLMHAHFAKLRTQALASLHSGLQINQGIPISQIVNWLGLEGEDVENLLEFYGFALRKYEEMYMVKEGSFLNSDTDYAVKRSQLVHLKKSKNIVDDVRSGPLSSEIKMERGKKAKSNTADVKTSTLTKESWVSNVDETVESKVDYIPKFISMPQQTIEEPVEKMLDDQQEDHEMANVLPISNVETNFEVVESSPNEANLVNDEIGSEQEQTVEFNAAIGMNRIIDAGVSASLDEDSMMETRFVENDTNENGKEEALTLLAQQKEEAFREKLKLIIRKWKERSSVLREIREQKEYLANLALNSLSLGPPIRRQSGVQPSFVNDDLNFDHVATERFYKLEKSRARLNVAEITSPILSFRNTDCDCIVWKLLLLVHANDIESQTYTMALKWLRSKVMASDVRPDNDLLLSSPGLSVWMHTSPSQAPCFSIIKESSLEEEDNSTSGACCSLFLASGHVSWDMQRIQIQKLVDSIPYGASLPLLVLVTDTNEEAANIINRLGLHEADREKICSTSIIFLSANSFFDDDELIEGLRWLAINSPLQPKLQAVDTRELVMNNLRNSITALENIVIEPNHCISVFNEALNNSAEQIKAAASANPSNWPAPEINAIRNLNLNLNLPGIGWNSDEKIDPIVSALRQCSLPSISNEMPWLISQNSLQDQKLAIEKLLANYLTQSGLLNYELAAREASIMVQSNASLELRGTCHYIIPRWFNIFQRIFNWQLMKLRRNELSEAYVLENEINNRVEEYQPLSYVQSEITLDAMMDISCNVPFMEQKSMVSENQFTSREVDLGTENFEGGNDEMEVINNEGSGYGSPVSSKSENRLEMLFEKCKLVQDRIDAKLSIYGCNL